MTKLFTHLADTWEVVTKLLDELQLDAVFQKLFLMIGEKPYPLVK